MDLTIGMVAFFFCSSFVTSLSIRQTKLLYVFSSHLFRLSQRVEMPLLLQFSGMAKLDENQLMFILSTVRRLFP